MYRRRKKRRSWTSFATMAVPLMIWMLGMWMILLVIASWALGKL